MKESISLSNSSMGSCILSLEELSVDWKSRSSSSFAFGWRVGVGKKPRNPHVRTLGRGCLLEVWETVANANSWVEFWVNCDSKRDRQGARGGGGGGGGVDVAMVAIDDIGYVE